MEISSPKSVVTSRFAATASLVLAILVVLSIGGASYSDAGSTQNDRSDLKTTRTILAQTESLTLELDDLESSQRGFLLTGKDKYLGLFDESTASIRRRMEVLKDLAAGRPKQQELVAKLRLLVEAKLTELNETLQAKRTVGSDVALALIMSDRGKILMDQIRIVTAEKESESERRIADVTAVAQKRADRTRFVSVAGSIVLLILFVTATVIINRSMTQRERLTVRILDKEIETARARDLLQTTLASIGDGVISTDSSGAITFLNAAAEKLTGWSTELAAGRPQDEVFRIVDESTLETVEGPLNRALREGKIVSLADRTLLITKDGRKIAIDDSAAPIPGPGGKIEGAVLVFRDISPRRNAEKALVESEKRFRAVFARAPVGMVLTGTDAKFIDCNETYCGITGFTAEELPGTRFLSLTHPEDAIRNEELFTRLVAGEIPSYVIEKRIRRKTGEIIWVRASATLLRDGEGRPEQIVGLVENIDLRKHAEAAVAFKTRVAELGSDIGKALTRAEQLPDALQSCAQAIVDHLDAAFARIWTTDETGAFLNLEASAGLYTHRDGAHSRIPVGSYKIGLIAHERKPHLTNDVATDERVGNREWAAQNGMVAFAGYPLLLEDKLIGVLGMFSRNRLSAETLEALGSAANSIAIGIERKRSEEALLRQWHLFDTALSSNPDHIYTFNLEGRITYANRALLGLWQRSLEESLGKNFFDLGYPPELAERLHRQIKQVVETASHVRDQVLFSGLDGNTRYYDYIFAPVFDPDGHIEAVAGSNRDITQRRQFEEELQESKERLNFALAAGGGVGTWDWNVEAGRVFCNPRLADIFSIDPEMAVSGAPISALLDAIHPDDRSWVGERILQATKSNEDFAAEYRLIRKDGSITWVYAQGRCHHDEAGKPTRFPGVIFDTSERKKVEQDLRESETRLAFIAESIPPMVWTATPDGALDYVNRRGQEYFGVQEDSLLGAGWLSFVHPDDQNVTTERWMQSLATGEPYEVSFRLRRGRDKTWRWHLSRALAFSSASSCIIQWFGTCTDIQDQKVAETELLRANRELEEFAYVASHDLQEPLRMVNIYTQLITRRFLSDKPEAEKFAGFVNEGVHRMETLIRDLLTFSRSVYLEERTHGPANLDHALAEARSVLQDRFEESNAVMIASTLPTLQGDESQLAHVFQNVLSNAIKYRRKDAPPKIVVSAEEHEKECIVSFKDNGIGFDPQYAERIFGLFKRLHKDEYPGTGLGLAICQRVIERHGGRMWAESKVGEGSTFHIALPSRDGL